MAEATTGFELALKFVRSMELPHPDGQLLECFLQDSADPVQAARYMLQRCFAGGGGLDLESFVSDWKQLINMCTSDEVPSRVILITNSCLRRPDLPTS